MLKTIASFFKRQKSRKPNFFPQASICVYRDELDKRPLSRCRKVKKQVKFDLEPREEQKADGNYGSDGGGAVVGEKNGGGGGRGLRVKVLMTREEANRLLSRCGDGGVLTFMDVAEELKDIPLNHITMISSSSSPLSCCDDKLETIQEEARFWSDEL